MSLRRTVFIAWLVMTCAVRADWHHLDNGVIRLGVDLSAGACVGWLSASRSPENLLNTYDVGRYVQQSYYGDADGSDWNGKPWRYNPVQGGSWKNEASKILGIKIESNQFYAKIEPRQWASGVPAPECVMEQWVRLEGDVAKLRFKMTYTGLKTHAARHQELPALFVSPRLATLVFAAEDGVLQQAHPGAANEYLTLGEPWCAWVGADGRGVGIRMPHTRQITCYRVRNGNAADCSYLAPIQTFALKPGLVFEYEVDLSLGTSEELRQRFMRPGQP